MHISSYGASVMFRALCWIALVASTAGLSTVMFSAPVQAREAVTYSGPEAPGTVVIRTKERLLYFVVGEGRAIRYPVGVGRSGKQWFGSTSIVSKHVRPAWAPPEDMMAGRPYFVIPSGAPNNPMGAAALVLADHELAVHGTNKPSSVGGFVSSGCIRMHNEDVTDLFERVRVGTRVVISH